MGAPVNWFTMSEQCAAEYQQMRWQWFWVVCVLGAAFIVGHWLWSRRR
jgi:hypothetical protein